MNIFWVGAGLKCPHHFTLIRVQVDKVFFYFSILNIPEHSTLETPVLQSFLTNSFEEGVTWSYEKTMRVP